MHHNQPQPSRVPTPGITPRSAARSAEYAALTAHRARLAGTELPLDLTHDTAYVAYRSGLMQAGK